MENGDSRYFSRLKTNGGNGASGVCPHFLVPISCHLRTPLNSCTASIIATMFSTGVPCCTL